MLQSGKQGTATKTGIQIGNCHSSHLIKNSCFASHELYILCTLYTTALLSSYIPGKVSVYIHCFTKVPNCAFKPASAQRRKNMLLLVVSGFAFAYVPDQTSRPGFTIDKNFTQYSCFGSQGRSNDNIIICNLSFTKNLQ